jgi:hypothetical protein
MRRFKYLLDRLALFAAVMFVFWLLAQLGSGIERRRNRSPQELAKEAEAEKSSECSRLAQAAGVSLVDGSEARKRLALGDGAAAKDLLRAQAVFESLAKERAGLGCLP